MSLQIDSNAFSYTRPQKQTEDEPVHLHPCNQKLNLSQHIRATACVKKTWFNQNLKLSKDLFYLLKNRRKFQYRKSPNTKITPPSYLKILVIYLGPLDNLKLCINTCSSLIMCSSSFVDNSNLHLHTIIKCKLFCLKTLCNFLKNGGYACPSFLGLFLLSTSFRLPFLVFLYFTSSFLSPTLCCKRIILCLYV